MQAFVTIAEFKRHLKAAGYAAATIASYSHGLALFLAPTFKRVISTI